MDTYTSARNMDKIKERLKRFVTPRRNTDLQSEILDVISPPIYVYTITYVVYFGYAHLTEYHYGDGGTTDTQPWLVTMNKIIAVLVYFQMMGNWLCIRYVDTSLKTITERNQVVKARFTEETVKEINDAFNLQQTGGTKNSTDKKLLRPSKRNGHAVGKSKDKVDNNSTNSNPGPAQITRRSYWSWKPCLICKLNAPPRCHHCVLCGYCVLKRDHHCFFSGRCVGFHNQRHFVAFLLWAFFGTSYGMIHFVPYLYNVVLREITPIECFAPVTIVTFLLGYGDFYHTNLIVSFSLNLFFVLLTLAFICEQYTLISEGWTQFEKNKVDKRKLKIHDPRPLSVKVRAVFGRYPVLALVFPWAHWVSPPCDDPFEWHGYQIKHF